MLSKKFEKIQDKDTEKELERKRREFIERGGTVSSDVKSEWTNINFRLKTDMIKKIDDIIKTKRIGLTRTGWILEAIQEKFNREET